MTSDSDSGYSSDAHKTVSAQRKDCLAVHAVAQFFYGPSPSGTLSARLGVQQPVSMRDDRIVSVINSHTQWFAGDQKAQRRRGVATRQAIAAFLEHASVLTRPINSADIARVLRNALTTSRLEGRPHFIAPGLITPPNVPETYTVGGQRFNWPGIRWSNFKPALLKVTYKDTISELEIIEIKSSKNTGIDTANKFQLLVYRHFLGKLLPSLLGHPHRLNPTDYLCHLRLTPNASLWTYTGCVSKTCKKADCFLNQELNMSPKEFEDRLRIGSVGVDAAWIKKILYKQLPCQLEREQD